jgi:hypothetical protein
MKSAKSILIPSLLPAILVITLCAAALPPSLIQPDLPAILKDRSRAAQLPPTDSAILHHLISIAILDSGRADRTEHLYRYLRSDNAWDDYGDPHLSYDEARQSLQVYALTHTLDGRAVQTDPKNGHNPMVPFGLDLAPDFSHYRQTVVTHLGIEPDAVTDLAWIIREQKSLYPWAWGEITLGGHEPILDKLVLVGAPSSQNLKVVSLEAAPEAEHWVENHRDIYGWRIKDQPARNLSEAGSKPSQELPRIAYSTCPDWNTLTRAINQRFTAAVEQQEGLKAELAKFESLPNAQQRLDSTVSFLKDRIVRVSWDELGMLINFRTAEKTFASGYGSPADLAVLTTAALKVLGFQPEVYLSAQNLMPLPGLTGKEGYLISICQDGLEAQIDPVSGQIHWHAPQDVALIGIYPAKEPQILPPAPAVGNTLELSFGFTMEADRTAEGWFTLDSHGAVSLYDEARSSDSEELIKKWTGKLFASPEIKEARVTELSPDRVVIQANLQFPATKDTLGEFLRLAMPWDVINAGGFAPHGLVLNYNTRDLPLFLDHAGAYKMNLLVNYPESWTPAAIPTAREIKAEGIALRRTVTGEKGVLRIQETVNFTSEQVSPQNWDAWRKVLLAACKASERTLLLKAE